MSDHLPQHSPHSSPRGSVSGPSSSSIGVMDAGQTQAQMQALFNQVQLLTAQLAAQQQQQQQATPSMSLSSPAVASPRPSSLKGPTTPEFNGINVRPTDIDDWLMSLEQVFAFYGVRDFPDDAARVKHATLFFRSHALRWWNTLAHPAGVMTSWNTFMTTVRERYRPLQASAAARERLDSLKQRGAMSAYCDLFLKELTPVIAEMDAGTQVHAFVRGITNATVQEKVREKEPKSLHEAMDIAVRADARRTGHQSYPSRPYSYAPATGSSMPATSHVPMDVNAVQGDYDNDYDNDNNDRNDNDRTPAIEALVEKLVEARLAALHQPASSSQGQVGRGRSGGGRFSAEKERLYNEGKCFRCKKPGHRSRDCKADFQ